MNADRDFEPETIRHFIYVAEPVGTVVPYAVLTDYLETDPINAVGQVFRFDLDRDPALASSVLSTNDNLTTIWSSPEGNLWVGSSVGRIWTTADVNWDANRIPGLDWEQSDPSFNWKATELPRRERGLTCNVAAIWGSSDRDVHLGTFDGRILHWDGAQWRFSFVENHDAIIRMHGSGADDGWAVGREGLVLHFDGSGWRRLALPGDVSEGETLTGVWARSADEVFICARSGAIYNGSRHGLTRVGDYAHSFFGIAEFKSDLFLAGGDDGVCVLRGNRVHVERDTFAAVGVYRLNDRIAFAEPIQQPAEIVIFDPADASPWSSWSEP